MKFSTSKEDLIRCLDLIIGATKQTGVVKSVLSCAHLKVEKQRLTMTATDYEVQIKSFCDVEADGDFEQLVNAGKLLKICRVMDNNQNVTLSFDGNNAKVTSGRSVFNLVTQNTEEFSFIGEQKKEKKIATLYGKQLLTGLRSVNYASSQQSHRLALNGTLIESDAGQINFVATDGHRMAVKKLAADEKTEMSHILPRRCLDLLLQRLKEEDHVEINAVDKFIQFKTDRFDFISNIIEENYPDYRSVVPRNNDKIAVVERDKILPAIKRAVVLSDQKAKIYFNFDDNKLEINSSNKDNDNLQEAIDVKYDAEKITICFDASFFLDMLNTIEYDVIKVGLSDEKSSVLIEPAEEDNSFIYVVMPILT